MRKKEREQDEARLLRAQGLSLRQIGRRLDVSFSSVSVWVRDVPLPEPPPDPLPPEPEPDTEPFRRCSRCGEILPASSFNSRGADRQWWCRECFKVYFQARGERHLQQVKTAKRRRRTEANTFITRYLATHPCLDCGESDPLILEFDHLRDKRAAVSWLRAQATGCPGLAEEIAKCEVVCTNCHRRRTARRANWWRLSPDGVPSRSLTRPQIRNMRHVFRILRESGCVDCGERDLVVLDFDHRGRKRDCVVRLAYSGYSIRRLDEEIGVCEVRCANCHRRRTKAASSDAA